MLGAVSSDKLSMAGHFCFSWERYSSKGVYCSLPIVLMISVGLVFTGASLKPLHPCSHCSSDWRYRGCILILADLKSFHVYSAQSECTLWRENAANEIILSKVFLQCFLQTQRCLQYLTSFSGNFYEGHHSLHDLHSFTLNSYLFIGQ